MMCLETGMAIWEAEYCSGGYAQHSGANCGGDHGQVYAISNEKNRHLSPQAIP